MDKMDFGAVIGLEIHAQLLTKTKIFCRCSTRFGASPNANTCPVCLGLPGALPVLNRQAVAMALKVGMALNCRINSPSLFARKNYFYPDLPKGFQISQLELPLAEEGYVDLKFKEAESGEVVTRHLRLNRVHMEDDAGKSVHSPSGDTLVNLNRTGTPLIEIVTEADFRTSQEAYEFLIYLRKVLRYLEVCDGNMEEGSMRCDANVSIRPRGQEEFGTKTEIKNLNSFRFVRKAIDYEIGRQIDVVSDGGRIFQETRLWDDASGRTEVMRSKEESHDYRYFPEPDLLPLVIDEDWKEILKAELPELPDSRRDRFVREYGLEEDMAVQLTSDHFFADYFEAAVREHDNPAAIGNWMLGELTFELKQAGAEIGEFAVSPLNLARLLKLVDESLISGKIAKEVFAEMVTSGENPETIVSRKGLKQISDTGELDSIINGIIEGNPEKVAAYRNGKTGLIGFFVGQVMQQTGGQANPQVVNQLLREKL
jgi:aspartyl-tRNA(Asn)/glutamyl-tRNA(Gln) amidotransferase subunit B